jgi:hypothetical protein
MNIVQNVRLRALATLGEGDGWETSVGQAFKTVLYTGNYFAAYSSDGASSFRRISPWTLAKSVGLQFCCDQVAHYIPAANVMVWIILSVEGPIIMCLARPEDLQSSKGNSWTVYVLSGPVFRRGEKTEFDYPQVSFGGQFMYLTFNVIGTAGAVVCRFEMGQLRERSTIHFQYFDAADNSYICPCQLSEDRGVFVVQNSTSQLRLFLWPENSNTISVHDINIATIPTADWVTLTPDGNDWLEPNSKIDSTVQGVARARNEIWVAWTGARKVEGHRENSFPHPHIGIAVIDVYQKKLLQQRYLWNNDHAFAYPSLAANPNGEIAISFMWGGIKHYVNHGVGYLKGQTELVSVTGDDGLSGGGHYITARMSFPEIASFISAGYNTPKDASLPAGRENQPRYVVYWR